MTAVLLLLTALTALAGWLCLSPIRLAAAGSVLLFAHPVLTVTLTTVAALALTVAAVRIVHRSLRDGGWHLVTVQRPAFAVSRAGGMAS
ncbi:hypothetical protein [Actinomadura rupiterrae]|uniref:hypothetical protein n=1 Tax=Actinomadura rupiterrae TaxID=559627 RepID=UPI0020A34230|nr:hypothetical protein [Actinomadura rupiterrae]MCP2336975.1 membrane protein implicated in regulation of membrane protease activity [Actinomadura rupiterrae]